MQFLIPVLVGLMVLPSGVAAPAQVAHAKQEMLATSTPAVVAPSKLQAPKVAHAPFTTKLTAYNAVPGQTDNTPFSTAIGAFSNPEVVAARSSDLAYKLPYGTVIKIEREGYDTGACGYSRVESQIGYRVIADAMNPRIVNTVDVLLDQNNKVSYNGTMINPGRALGRCGAVTITVVGKLDIKDIPDTQAELRDMVEGQATQLAIR